MAPTGSMFSLGLGVTDYITEVKSVKHQPFHYLKDAFGWAECGHADLGIDKLEEYETARKAHGYPLSEEYKEKIIKVFEKRAERYIMEQNAESIEENLQESSICA